MRRTNRRPSPASCPRAPRRHRQRDDRLPRPCRARRSVRWLAPARRTPPRADSEPREEPCVPSDFPPESVDCQRRWHFVFLTNKQETFKTPVQACSCHLSRKFGPSRGLERVYPTPPVKRYDDIGDTEPTIKILSVKRI